MRQRVERLMSSPSWDHLSGSSDYSHGGEKWLYLNGEVQQAYAEAQLKMFSAYPKLYSAMSQAGILEGAALSGGQDRVNEVKGRLGPLLVTPRLPSRTR